MIFACEIFSFIYWVLKQSIIQAFNNLDQETINRAINDWPRRLDAVIEKQGGYFKQYHCCCYELWMRIIKAILLLTWKWLNYHRKIKEKIHMQKS
jgi:hypothetical protein